MAYQQSSTYYDTLVRRSVPIAVVIDGVFANIAVSAQNTHIDCLSVTSIGSELDTEEGYFVDDTVEFTLIDAAIRTAEEAALKTLLFNAATQTSTAVFMGVFIDGERVFIGPINKGVQFNDQHLSGGTFAELQPTMREYKFTAAAAGAGLLDVEYNTIVPALGGFLALGGKVRSGYYDTPFSSTDNAAHSYITPGALVGLNYYMRGLFDGVKALLSLDYDILIDDVQIPYTFYSATQTYDNAWILGGALFPLVNNITNGATEEANKWLGDSRTLSSEQFWLPFDYFFDTKDSTSSFSTVRRFKTLGDFIGAVARSFYLVPRFYWDNNGDLHLFFAPRKTFIGNEIRVADVTAGDGGVGAEELRSVEKILFRGRTSFHTMESDSADNNDAATTNTNNQLIRSGATASAADGSRDVLELAFGIGSPVITYTSGTDNVFKNVLRTNGSFTDVRFGRGVIPYSMALGMIRKTDTNPFIAFGYTVIRHVPEEFRQWRGSTTATPGIRSSLLHVLTGTDIVLNSSSGQFPLSQCRRISALGVDIDGEIKKFFSLQSFCNEMQRRDFAFFSGEYDITVPSLVAFTPNTTNIADASISNLKLGNVLSINATGVGGAQYAIVGIKINIASASVQLKLQAVSRFAIDRATNGDTGIVTSGVEQASAQSITIPIAPFETIAAGQIVAVLDGEAYLAQPNITLGRYTTGIAIDVDNVEETVTIQVSGRYNVGTAEQGTLYYLDVDGGIKADPYITAPDGSNGTIVEVGRAVTDSDIEIVLNNTTYIYEEALTPP